jgi:hypothetical protein
MLAGARVSAGRIGMNKTTLVMIAVSATVLGLAGGAAGQEEPRETFEEELEVTEVLLDVLVTDGQGRVILGLGKDDFVVEEGGQPVEITGVTFYSSRELLASPEEAERLGPAADEVPEDRFFILFLQDQRGRGADAPRLVQRQVEAGQEVRRWVRQQMLPRDWMAVVSYQKKLKVHQDFTRNLEEIDAAIGRAIQGEDPGNIWPSRRADAEAEVSLLPGLPAGLNLRKETLASRQPLLAVDDPGPQRQQRRRLPDESDPARYRAQPRVLPREPRRPDRRAVLPLLHQL